MSAPSPADALCSQAREARQQGRFPEAIALFDQAIAADEQSMLAWEGRAYVAFVTKDFPRAIDCFRRVSMLDVRRPQPMVNLGAVYNRIGDFQNAVKSLRQAISRDRKCAEAYYNLGIAHKGLNQLSLAVSAYKEAIKVHPEMHDAHQNLANVYSEMNNLSQARLHYQKALQIRPDFEPARRALALLENAAETEKKKFSPFGRLVDTVDLENKDLKTRFRELNVQERFEDRQEKHRLCRETAGSVESVLHVLRDGMEPGLQRLATGVADGSDRHTLLREYELFRQIRQLLEKELAGLERHTSDLRTHETFIREG